jgi:hypothetical protein
LFVKRNSYSNGDLCSTFSRSRRFHLLSLAAQEPSFRPKSGRPSSFSGTSAHRRPQKICFWDLNRVERTAWNYPGRTYADRSDLRGSVPDDAGPTNPLITDGSIVQGHISPQSMYVSPHINASSCSQDPNQATLQSVPRRIQRVCVNELSAALCLNSCSHLCLGRELSQALPCMALTMCSRLSLGVDESMSCKAKLTRKLSCVH